MGRKIRSKTPHNWKYPMVHVMWEDAHTDSSWEEASDVKCNPIYVTTVGFLFRSTDDAIIVISSYSDEAITDRTRIPRGMVRNIEILEEAVPPKPDN